MIEKHSQITSSVPGHLIPAPALLNPQPVPFFAPEVNDFNPKQFLGLLKRQALVITGVVAVLMSAVIYKTLQEEPVYQGSFQLLVEGVNNDDKLDGLTLADSNISKQSLDYESQIQVLKSPELLSSVVNQLNSKYPDINYNSLIGNLNIQRLGQTKIIEVSYKSENTDKIKDILGIISNFYLKYSLEKRQTKLRQGAQFVEAQLPDIKKRVTQLQQELQNFRQRYDFVDPENQAAAIAQQMQNLSEQRLTINQKLAAANANFSSLQTKEGQLAVINNSPIYQQLIGQLRQLDSQISGELARFQPGNPIIQTLQDKRQNLLPVIQEEAKRSVMIKVAEAATMIQNVEVESQELASAEQQLKRKFEQLPVLARQYSEIQRNLQLANESLNRFLTTRENLQIEVAQTELPWELIKAPSLLNTPLSPNIQRSLLLGFIASLASGLGIALLREKLDNTYHSVESLKETIQLPVLGTLPFDKAIQGYQLSSLDGKTITQGKMPPSLPGSSGGLSKIFNRKSTSDRYYIQGKYWESLQVLYANMQLLGSDESIRSLIVSSAMPGDGKSTIAFNLAQIATAMGKRVLLVDADLRRPQIHNLTDLNNLWGLSNLISTNMPVEQVIQQSPVMDNLFVITAGPTPPDPARLLSSDKMKQLMANLHQNFDLVIYDVPPMLGLVDARLLAPQSDGVVLVVRLEQTDKSGLMQLQDSLRVAPINILGIVANGDKTNYQSYNYYYNANKQRN
jgi:succinoglycan biosynthesis transport protein ExoP